MRLLPHQKNASALRNLAHEALDLLAGGRFELLVERYGYALAFGRDLAEAVSADLVQALLDASGSQLMTMTPDELSVIYYRDNKTGLRAAIDCEVPSRGGRCVCVSFVVTGTEMEQFFNLEDISAKPGPDC